MRYIFILLLLTCPVRAQLYFTIDNRAKNAPDSVATTPAQLVDYLTEGLTSDTQKARVLASWIAYQIQRDGFRHDELITASNKNAPADPPLENNTFKTRIGTPQDFAKLYAQLGSLAGLRVAVIDGYAGHNVKSFRYTTPVYQSAEILMKFWIDKNYHLQRYRAAWNAVLIDDKWQLVDTYWMIDNEDLFAARDITNQRQMRLFLKKRATMPPSRNRLTAGKKINNDYFFAKPQQFVKTHFPFQDSWQLLSVPVTWSSFTTN